jgi:predicted homoserine dehydrogenase-like protein
MTAARALADDTDIPYYLAAGHRMVRGVSAGQAILCSDVEIDERSELFRQRVAQDGVGQDAWM